MPISSQFRLNTVVTLTLVAFVFMTHGQSMGPLGDKASTLARVQHIKQSTCKVLVDNQKSGTGFFISSDGLIVTNWHVIFNPLTRIDSTGKILSTFSIVDSMNKMLNVKILLNVNDEKTVQDAVLWDYCILKIDAPYKSAFLKIGSFSDAYEGAPVYTCGYPLDLNEPFITAGLISSFFFQTLDSPPQKFNRNVAWLDLTTNKGNSGGPLMLIGAKPEDDRVIGLTSFMITPNANIIEQLNQYVKSMEGKGALN